MRSRFSIAILLSVLSTSTEGWISSSGRKITKSTLLEAAIEEAATTSDTIEPSPFVATSAHPQLTLDLISNLRFRELRKELSVRELPLSGTTSQLRTRLRAYEFPQECVTDEDGEEQCSPVEPELQKIAVTFVDKSDPEFQIKDLTREIQQKAYKGHWKAATRRLKRLSRRFPEHTIDVSLYNQVLTSCMGSRLQGARASEPARKIMEQMVEKGYEVPEQAGNFCIKNCLGYTGLNSTHEGFGGIDTAIAMMTALKESETPIQPETFDRLAQALAREGSVPDALTLLKEVVFDKGEQPSLESFAAIARASVAKPEAKLEDKVHTVLAYAKTAGYNLDNIAATQDGRSILESGIIAAERFGNEALGLRLMTAAASCTVRKEAEEGDEENDDLELGEGEGIRADVVIVHATSAVERAATLIHKRAIIKAVEDGQWKLAVKVLELMLERKLRPSPWIWRNVVTCCAKASKSKRATALLLDWIRFAEQEGDVEKFRPPLSVFNTVINACEICAEEELTLVVLEAMKKTHDTDGNLITFNIALKRLAKQANFMACEGIIIGMLQANVEPSVVSYTTAIAACASKQAKQPQLAYEWVARMRSRLVSPNVLTYNTALAACLDGNLESTKIASKLADEMVADVRQQVLEEVEDEENAQSDEYTNVLPDAATKILARELMRQLKANWEAGDIDKHEAVETIRKPLLKLIDFEKSEAAQKAREMATGRKAAAKVDEDQAVATSDNEVELEYSTAASVHRYAEV